MFNTAAFVMVGAVAVSANVVAIPKLLAYSHYYDDTHTRKIELYAALAKGTFLAVVASAVGAYCVPKVEGLPSPFLESVIHLRPTFDIFWSQLRPTLIDSLYVLLGLVFLHLIFVRHHISASRYFLMPLSTKLLLEGVVEEIVYRWGLVSGIARILNAEWLDVTHAGVLAVILAAVGSSLSHISDLSRLHFDRINMALLAVILVNFWAALCYGWLYWKYDLITVILCHMLVIWISVLTYKARPTTLFAASYEHP
ncbi:MAG TPA: hypothetical protein VLC91_15845 [Spongiibacteraceae bacterium]|nr:hypothetical protein [Spongiibacteraceae bacterium]